MADSVNPNPTAYEQLDLGLYCSIQVLSESMKPSCLKLNLLGLYFNNVTY